jgi:hypothetical protein
MRTTIDGVLCDTATSTLIARRERPPDPDADMFGGYPGDTTELYRTILGHFFVTETDGIGIWSLPTKLLRKTEAMDLYESLPDKRLDFDDAFED